ncbi:efflux RND transporter periplasmic adaptor subunit [Schlegelella sp. S2-27]|uniref:Efflux RND transporter periplasmic adaptor subunit n=1 Tax=Caldimonas mangrovi TaxID=2944811 RepID=A0ABT0YQX7_9BURK|nr:efflux RND transporter periplasmic adaptor subunit [Caldimonas mangrovi]MCM5680238.1 efflux RND transporter periplasmic adaptor subunit [Caldimonas mangrovi]
MNTEIKTDAPAAAPTMKARRKQGLTLVAAVVLLAGVGYGAYHAFIGSRYESTDNAYVQGDLVQVTPQVGGTVLSVRASDTDFVKAGQTLVNLDPADARVALEQAEAQLAQTVREVRVLYANNSALQAQIAAREADLARAQAEVARAQDDVARRAPLVRTGAVGKEEFDHADAQLSAARSAAAAAQSAVLAAREQLGSNQSLTDGTTVERHPSVQRAAARVREAYLALKRVELPAPVDGYVARRSVQVGQRVQAGAPLMAIVPLKQVWVDANFKESQLQRLRIGQPVTLTADVYGDAVEFHGTVAGLGAGTGAAFSLLPAQNATGNWIKVVQRVPVRIVLDAQQLEAHPLQVGLSMEARVDVSRQDGKILADTQRSAAVSTTAVFDEADRDAQAEVERVIATHLGRPVRALASPRGGSAKSRPVAVAAGVRS